MAFRTNFERVYGFELLDDVHNFFPELMYDDEMFNNQMAAYMRHRVRTLFPHVYTRNENIYNIYERVNRRRNYATWHESHFPSIAAPPLPRNALFQIPQSGAQINMDLSGIVIPILQTPPSARRLIGVNTIGGRLPPRREVSWFAEGEPFAMLSSDETNAFTTGVLNLFAAGAFRDVEVSLTSEQITAGSQIRATVDISPDTVCAICLDNPSEGSAWRALRCSHLYHTECIDTWFQSHVACPVCRTDLRTFTAQSGRGT